MQTNIDLTFHELPFLRRAQQSHSFLESTGIGRIELEPREKIEWLAEIA